MGAIHDLITGVEPQIWGLIGVALAAVLTLQAVETSVEGAWPHQRRATRTIPSARMGQRGWAVVGVVLLIALVIGILNLAVMAWKDLSPTSVQTLGAVLVGLAWAIFLAATTERWAIGRYIRRLGVAAPSALTIMLLAGGLLLLVGFVDIMPTFDEVKDALPIQV